MIAAMKGICRAVSARLSVLLVLAVLLLIALAQLMQFVYLKNPGGIGDPEAQDTLDRSGLVQDTAKMLLRVEEAAKTVLSAAKIVQRAAEAVNVAQRDVQVQGTVEKSWRNASHARNTENFLQRSWDSTEASVGEVEALTQILLLRVSESKENNGLIAGLRNCSTLAAAGNVRGTCVDTNCTRHFSASAKDRVKQLLEPQFRLTKQQRKNAKDAARDVPQKRIIFVTAASSNHYQESQALVYNMRQHVFPKLAEDTYSFYYYDLGLTLLQRRRVEKNCNCTVKTFNMTLLPAHARHLMCYAWKPVILQALLAKAEIVAYMDVSIRFQPRMDMDRFLATVRRRGAQFLTNQDAIPNHTVRDMFDFYGDLPCQYWPYPELLAGFTVLHNEPFVRRLLLEPWVSCALHPRCMCTVDPLAKRVCPHVQRQVGQCHRFDLSSLTVLTAKLYGPAFQYLVFSDNHPPLIRRGQTMDFFTD